MPDTTHSLPPRYLRTPRGRALSRPVRADAGEAPLFRDRSGLSPDRRAGGLLGGRPSGLGRSRHQAFDLRSRPGRPPAARGLGLRSEPQMTRAPTPLRQLGSDGLTHVELTWIEKRIEHWIRFGRVAKDQIVDRRRRIVSFRPGAVFAFVRWAANDYGTVFSRIDIVRAIAAGGAVHDAAVRAARRRHSALDRGLAEGLPGARRDRRGRCGGRRSLQRRARSLAPRPQPHRSRAST